MEFFSQKLFLKGTWNCNWKLKPSVDSCLMSCNIFISANCRMPSFSISSKAKMRSKFSNSFLFFSETYSWKLRSPVESNDWYFNSKYSEWKMLSWVDLIHLRKFRFGLTELEYTCAWIGVWTRLDQTPLARENRPSCASCECLSRFKTFLFDEVGNKKTFVRLSLASKRSFV